MTNWYYRLPLVSGAVDIVLGCTAEASCHDGVYCRGGCRCRLWMWYCPIVLITLYTMMEPGLSRPVTATVVRNWYRGGACTAHHVSRYRRTPPGCQPVWCSRGVFCTLQVPWGGVTLNVVVRSLAVDFPGSSNSVLLHDCHGPRLPLDPSSTKPTAVVVICNSVLLRLDNKFCVPGAASPRTV